MAENFYLKWYVLQILMHVGTFWSKEKQSTLQDNFVPQPIDGSKFKRILSATVYPEAVDKMAWHLW